MKAYGDSSWWLAYKINEDVHHGAAIRFFNQVDGCRVAWTPWQRLEIFNSLHQFERRGDLGTNRARDFIRQLENEVRLGYWPHVEFSWTNAVRRANEISTTHGPNLRICGMDLFHLAIAREIEADLLLTFDADQATLAEAIGIPVHAWT